MPTSYGWHYQYQEFLTFEEVSKRFMEGKTWYPMIFLRCKTCRVLYNHNELIPSPWIVEEQVLVKLTKKDEIISAAFMMKSLCKQCDNAEKICLVLCKL